MKKLLIAVLLTISTNVMANEYELTPRHDSAIFKKSEKVITSCTVLYKRLEWETESKLQSLDSQTFSITDNLNPTASRINEQYMNEKHIIISVYKLQKQQLDFNCKTKMELSNLGYNIPEFDNKDTYLINDYK